MELEKEIKVFGRIANAEEWLQVEEGGWVRNGWACIGESFFSNVEEHDRVENRESTFAIDSNEPMLY